MPSTSFPAVYWLLTIAAFLTAFYMGRQIWMVFFGKPRHAAAAHAEESPKVITVPLMVLAALSILGGALNLPGRPQPDTLAGTYHRRSSTKPKCTWLATSWWRVQSDRGCVTVLALIAIYISWLHLRAQAARSRSEGPAQETARFHLHRHGKQVVRGRGLLRLSSSTAMWTSPASWRT